MNRFLCDPTRSRRLGSASCEKFPGKTRAAVFLHDLPGGAGLSQAANERPSKTLSVASHGHDIECWRPWASADSTMAAP